MKKLLFSLILTVMIFAVGTTYASENGEVYENAEFGAGIIFPPEYEGKYTPNINGNSLDILHTVTAELLMEEYGYYNGRLFSIKRVPLTNADDSYMGIPLFETSEYAYFFWETTGVEFYANKEHPATIEYLSLTSNYFSRLNEMLTNIYPVGAEALWKTYFLDDRLRFSYPANCQPNLSPYGDGLIINLNNIGSGGLSITIDSDFHSEGEVWPVVGVDRYLNESEIVNLYSRFYSGFTLKSIESIQVGGLNAQKIQFMCLADNGDELTAVVCDIIAGVTSYHFGHLYPSAESDTRGGIMDKILESVYFYNPNITYSGAEISDESVVTIVPPTLDYDAVSYFRCGLAVASRDGKYGYIDKTGNVAIPFEYEWAGEFKDGFALITENHKYGLIDTNGKIIIPAEYDWISPVNEGLVTVRKGSAYGFLNDYGEIVIPLSEEYESAGYIGEGMFMIKRETDYLCVLLDEIGNIITETEYTWIDSFHDGLAAVYKDGLWGYVDNLGNEVITPSYAHVSDFYGGLAKVYPYDSIESCFINQKGEVVFAVEPENADYTGWGFFDERLYTGDGEKYGFLDPGGQIAIPLEYNTIQYFSEGLAGACKDGKWGFIDIAGEVVVPFEYDSVDSFKNGYACVEKNGKWGYVNKSGDIVVPLKYDGAWDFNEGLALVSKDGLFGIMESITANIYADTLYKLGDIWARAICRRDADTLYYLLNDKSDFDKIGGYYNSDGSRTIGMSSPWPWYENESKVILISDDKVDYILLWRTSTSMNLQRASILYTLTDKGYQVTGIEYPYPEVSSMRAFYNYYDRYYAYGLPPYEEYTEVYQNLANNDPDTWGYFYDPVMAATKLLEIENAETASIIQPNGLAYVTFTWLDGETTVICRQPGIKGDAGVWVVSGVYYPVNPADLQYARIRLGSNAEQVVYRLDEPNMIIDNDSLQTYVYRNLGEVYAVPVEGEPYTIPGDDIDVFLDTGYVCRISVYGVSSVILSRDLDIADDTYDRVIGKLGTPSHEILYNEKVVISYQHLEDNDKYLYFVFSDGLIVEHGLTINPIWEIFYDDVWGD